jgi:hypothetical protein
MDWNNLPAKGDYVAVMLNAVSYLVPAHGEHRNVLIGQSVVEPLTPAESSMPMRVTTGEGAVFEPSIVANNNALALTYGPVEKAQFLNLSIGPASRVVAANVDSTESNLKSVDDRKLTAALGRPVRILTDAIAADQRPVAAKWTELASVALYAVIALLLAEIWMAMWFGSPRETAAGNVAA